jgi:hypothetical protein
MPCERRLLLRRPERRVTSDVGTANPTRLLQRSVESPGGSSRPRRRRLLVAGARSYVQRVHDELGPQVLGIDPADDASPAAVEDRGQVPPSIGGRHVGNARHPQRVELLRGERADRILSASFVSTHGGSTRKTFTEPAISARRDLARECTPALLAA